MPLLEDTSIRQCMHFLIPCICIKQAGRQADGRSSISFYEVLCANALLAMRLGARVVSFVRYSGRAGSQLELPCQVMFGKHRCNKSNGAI